MRKRLRCLASRGDFDTGVLVMKAEKKKKHKPKLHTRRWLRMSITACFAAVSMSLSGYLFFPEEMRHHEDHHPHTHTEIVEVPQFGGSNDRGERGMRS